MNPNTTGHTFSLLILALAGSALSQACGNGGGDTTSSSAGSGGDAASSSSGSGGHTTSSSASGGAGGASATSSTSSGPGGTSSSSTAQGGISSSSGGTGGQGAADGGTVGLCGANACREDQACVAGHCTTACVGTQVPGDYATVQGAVTALQAVGGTICLGPQTFAEQVSIVNTQPLTIVGTSDLSEISGFVNIKGQSSVTLQNFTVLPTSTMLGVEVVAAVHVFDNTGSLDVVLRGIKMGSTDAFGAGFVLEETTHAVTILLDGCDLTGPPDNYALSLTSSHGGIGDTLSMVVQNSYLHDAMVGMYSEAILMSLSLVNDTIVNNGTGIEAQVGDEQLSLSTFNTIITGSDVGISLSGSGGSMASGNNLLFGNTTNYMGVAVQGPGYVKADPLFDTSTPPGLGAGSPARGAADPTQAPATDYYGHARPANPDMGAVQM